MRINRKSTRNIFLCGGIIFVLSALPLKALASLITVAGDQFDITYDDTRLGAYGAPNLVGGNLIFTPNTFKVNSINGVGQGSSISTLAGVVLSAHSGFRFSGLSLAQFGDYLMSGTGSVVGISGEMVAFSPGNPATTSSSVSLAVSPFTPLTFADLAPHDWLATVAVTAGASGIASALFNSAQIGFSLQTTLTALTPAQAAGFVYAFGEMKAAVVGVQTTDDVAPVPLPPAWLLLISGCALVLVGPRTMRSTIKLIRKCAVTT